MAESTNRITLSAEEKAPQPQMVGMSPEQVMELMRETIKAIREPSDE